MRNALFGTVITVWSFNSFMRFRNLLLLQFNTALWPWQNGNGLDNVVNFPLSEPAIKTTEDIVPFVFSRCDY